MVYEKKKPQNNTIKKSNALFLNLISGCPIIIILWLTSNKDGKYCIGMLKTAGSYTPVPVSAVSIIHYNMP